ncbi:hypothetical protein AF088_14395, partial [Listeria monocytogenes]|nr:hypothetical protein [Listeria monocytogenes]
MVEMVLSSSRYQSSSVTTKSKSTIQAYESVIESLQSFINEDNLSSMAYNNGKSYYGSVLVPFVKASILLTEAVSEACQKFVDTYYAEVDSCDLDSDRLERQINEAKMRIAHLESIRQDIALKDIPDYAKEQQLMYNDKTMEPILSMKKDLEDKLEKLLEFEATSPEIFSNITDLKAIIDKGKAQTDVSWNGSAFVIPKDLSWTNTVTDKWKIRLDQIKAKEEAYHMAKRKELEGYNVYAWVYQDPKTKEVQVMWFIDKDGVRIFDEELQDYVEKYGKDLEGIYEIVGWDKIYELDLAARRRGDGKNYLNENQLPGDFTQWFAQKGAVLDSAYWYGEKTGLLDLAMMVGLSYAATKSQMKGSTTKKASGTETIKQPNDFATEPFLPEEYYKNNYSSMDGIPNSRMEYNRLGSSGNVEKSVIIYDSQGKQSIRIDYSDHGNSLHHTNPHIHEYEWFDGGRAANETKYFLNDEGIFK